MEHKSTLSKCLLAFLSINNNTYNDALKPSNVRISADCKYIFGELRLVLIASRPSISPQGLCSWISGRPILFCRGTGVQTQVSLRSYLKGIWKKSALRRDAVWRRPGRSLKMMRKQWVTEELSVLHVSKNSTNQCMFNSTDMASLNVWVCCGFYRWSLWKVTLVSYLNSLLSKLFIFWILKH